MKPLLAASLHVTQRLFLPLYASSRSKNSSIAGQLCEQRGTLATKSAPKPSRPSGGVHDLLGNSWAQCCAVDKTVEKAKTKNSNSF